jgi:hypothetical protein
LLFFSTLNWKYDFASVSEQLDESDSSLSILSVMNLALDSYLLYLFA